MCFAPWALLARVAAGAAAAHRLGRAGARFPLRVRRIAAWLLPQLRVARRAAAAAAGVDRNRWCAERLGRTQSHLEQGHTA